MFIVSRIPNRSAQLPATSTPTPIKPAPLQPYTLTLQLYLTRVISILTSLSLDGLPTHHITTLQRKIDAAILPVRLSFNAMTFITEKRDARCEVLHLELYLAPSPGPNTSRVTHAGLVPIQLPVPEHCRRADLRIAFGSHFTFAHLILSLSRNISFSSMGTIACGGVLSSEEARDLLHRCAGCHTLQIVDPHKNNAACLRVLGENPPLDVLPRLRHLWLTCDPLVKPHTRPKSPRISLENLVNRLSSRREKAIDAGGMPTHLTIDSSVVFAEKESEVQRMMLALAELVPNIDWRRS